MAGLAPPERMIVAGCWSRQSGVWSEGGSLYRWGPYVMKRSMRYVFVLASLLVFLALACGDDEAGGSASPTETSVSPPVSTPADTPESPPAPTEESSAAQGTQRSIVEASIGRSQMVEVGCLDVNADARIDASDADPNALADLTGDDEVDEADLEVIRKLDLVLPNGRPAGCAERHPIPDWQVSEPAAVDCDAGESGLVVLGVGGGPPPLNLGDPSVAAGMRWMLPEIGEALDSEGVSRQLASVAPALNDTNAPNSDAEAWATAYLTSELTRTPCLSAVLFGHSHGGMLVKTVAARLEEAGLGDRILLTALVDPVSGFYGGDPEAMPQTSPVFNIYQENDSLLHWHPLEGANVENWDASGETAPEGGDEGGGALIPVNHTNVDNAQSVLEQLRERIVEAACNRGLC